MVITTVVDLHSYCTSALQFEGIAASLCSDHQASCLMIIMGKLDWMETRWIGMLGLVRF